MMKKRRAQLGGGDTTSKQDYEPPELEQFGESEHKAEVQKVIAEALVCRIKILQIVTRGGVGVPDTRKKALASDLWPEFEKAERIELDAFVEPDVWVFMPRPKGSNINIIGTRWVYDVKLDSNGEVTRYKARLVAQGFSQKKGIDYNETFAPTMHVKTMRVLLTLAARLDIEVRQYDVSNAFLHANIDYDVYVKQPPGYEKPGKEGWVYKLRKAMYGLKNAPRAYSDHFMKVLASLGFTQSKQDACLWTLRKGKFFVHYLFHVDDIMVVANDDELREFCLVGLKRKLKIRDEGPIDKFLGVNVRRVVGGYEISQTKYIEKVAARFSIDDSTRPVSTPEIASKRLVPATETEKREAEGLEFQELVGCLIYANMSRPDIAYAISNVARFMGGWSKEHYDAARRILVHLYTTRNQSLILKPANTAEPMVWGFVDANCMDARESGDGTDDKWKPQGGYIMVWDGCVVSWRSSRMKSRVLSSMESEYYVACEGAKEAIWLRRLVKELGFGSVMEKQTPIYEDNKACIAYSKNNTCHDRTKHIDNKAYFLRDHVKEGDIELIHISTNDQLADMMTKTQEKQTFLKHKERIFSETLQQPKRTFVGEVRAEVREMLLEKKCTCMSCFVGGMVHVQA
jgi:hypothetical protein